MRETNARCREGGRENSCYVGRTKFSHPTSSHPGFAGIFPKTLQESSLWKIREVLAIILWGNKSGGKTLSNTSYKWQSGTVWHKYTMSNQIHFTILFFSCYILKGSRYLMEKASTNTHTSTTHVVAGHEGNLNVCWTKDRLCNLDVSCLQHWFPPLKYINRGSRE